MNENPDLERDLANIRDHEHLPLSEVQKLAKVAEAEPLFDSLLVVASCGTPE